MKIHTSEAQLEVWAWKKNLYEELKPIAQKETLAYINAKVKNTVAKIQKTKQALLECKSNKV